MPQAPYASTIADIFLAAKYLVSTSTGLDPSKVFVVVPGWADKVRDCDEDHITLRLEPPKSVGHPDNYAGAGRLGCRVRRNMVATIFTRSSVDQIGRSDGWWTNTNTSNSAHYIKEDLTIDCLDKRYLFKIDQNTGLPTTTKVTTIPVHWLPGASPAKKTIPDFSWGDSALIFEVDYVQNESRNLSLGE